MEILSLGDLEFEIRRTPRRRTVGITIGSGGHLTADIPETLALESVKTAIRRRLPSIYKKLESVPVEMSNPDLRLGETLLWLGRPYVLKRGNDQQDGTLELVDGVFLLHPTSKRLPAQTVTDWYCQHATDWLSGPVESLAARLRTPIPAFTVRDLGFRWGSCSRNKLNFHWRLFRMPPSVITYVVAHEMVHLVEPGHGAEFERWLSRLMPDWKRRKQRLADLAREVD